VWWIVFNASAVLWPDLRRAHPTVNICPFYVAVVKISSTRVLFSIFYHLGSLQPLAMSCSVRRPDGSLTDSRCFADEIKPQLPSLSSCVSITITDAMLQHSSKKTHRIVVTVVKNCKVFAVPFCPNSSVHCCPGVGNHQQRCRGAAWRAA
jgi:hypothetical protein